MRRALGFLLLGLFLVGCPAPAGPPPLVVKLSTPGQGQVAWIGSAAGPRLKIECEDSDLADVMDAIGRVTGRNLLVDPNVSEAVTVSLNAIPAREAVEVLAKMTRCEVEDRGNGVLLLTQPGAPVLHFEDADVRTVLQLLAAYRGHDIVLPDSLKGSVSVNQVGVDASSIQQVLDQIGGYRVIYGEGGIARVESCSIAEVSSELSDVGAIKASTRD